MINWFLTQNFITLCHLRYNPSAMSHLLALAQLCVANKLAKKWAWITSCHTSNQGTKTHDWDRCYAHFLASFSAVSNCASVSKCNVALGRHCTLVIFITLELSLLAWVMHFVSLTVYLLYSPLILILLLHCLTFYSVFLPIPWCLVRSWYFRYQGKSFSNF